MSSVANRYVKALFRVALEQDKLDRVAEDFEMLQHLIHVNADLKNLLLNPLIPNKKRIDLLQQVFKNKTDSLTFDFIMLVCEKKRLVFLEEMMQNFANRVLTHKGIVPGVIRSAMQLSAEQSQEIGRNIKNMTGKNVVFKEEIDPELVGGFVIKVKDTVIDLSVKGQLERLREKLTHG